MNLQPFQEHLHFTSLLVPFASGDSKQHFEKFQLLPSSKPTLQTNEGHKIPYKGFLNDTSPRCSPVKPTPELLAQHGQDREQLQPWRALGINQETNLNQGWQPHWKQAHRHLWSKNIFLLCEGPLMYFPQKPLLSPVAASFPTCYPEQPFITVIQS